MSDKKWIQGAVHPSKKGELHKELGVPQGKKIPEGKLEAAAKKGGKIGQRARFAENVRSIGDIVSKRKAKYGK